jgi:hypothetical protein
MRIFTAPVLALCVNITREIILSLTGEKCQLNIKKSVMRMINKPVTKPHPHSLSTGLISGTTGILNGRI